MINRSAIIVQNDKVRKKGFLSRWKSRTIPHAGLSIDGKPQALVQSHSDEICNDHGKFFIYSIMEQKSLVAKVQINLDGHPNGIISMSLANI